MGGHLYPSTTSQGLAALATFISSVNIAGTLAMVVKEPRVLFLKKNIYLSKLYTQCRARIHDPEIKIHMPILLSLLGAPRVLFLMKT